MPEKYAGTHPVVVFLPDSMPNAPKIFHSLQEFFQTIGLPLKQDTELTVHPLEGLHGNAALQSPTFRANYYTFMLIRTGKSRYVIDGQTFALGPGAFYFTNPGHLKSFQIEELLSGFMLTFSEAFVKRHFVGDFFQNFPFLIHETTPVMFLSPQVFQELERIFEQMLQEYESHAPYKNNVLTHHLSILLYKTKELLITHRVVLGPTSRAVELVIGFKNLLQANFSQLASGQAHKVLSVKAYADLLAVHPNHLSNTVKQATGKPASEWIQERTLAEAKGLLANTSRSISEIAFALGFSDTAHFAKFIKKHTGRSPGDYRKSSSL